MAITGFWPLWSEWPLTDIHCPAHGAPRSLPPQHGPLSMASLPHTTAPALSDTSQECEIPDPRPSPSRSFLTVSPTSASLVHSQEDTRRPHHTLSVVPTLPPSVPCLLDILLTHPQPPAGTQDACLLSHHPCSTLSKAPKDAPQSSCLSLSVCGWLPPSLRPLLPS